MVPLSAFAASSLVESSGVADSVVAAEPSPVVESAVNAAPSITADLETACGDAGLAMVAVETAGSIGELQQAALDALRGVCAEQGMPLPAPQPVAITQPSSPPPTSTSEQSVVVSGSDDHGGHGGDDEDDGDQGRHGGDDEDDDDHGHHGGDHD